MRIPETNPTHIIKELEKMSSRNEKIAFLSRYRHDKNVKFIFEMAYNPRIMFGIKNVKMPGTHRGVLDLVDAVCEAYNSFILDKIRGNLAHDIVENLLENLSKEDAEIFARVLNKDLRVGMNVKTLAKVWQEFESFEFPVMLCSSYGEKNIRNIEFPAIAQEKMDGVRCIIVVEDGMPRAFSRRGQSIDISGSVLEAEIIGIHDGVYDGELLAVDDNKNVLPRKIISGIVNEAIKGTVSEEKKDRLVFVAWDYIPVEDYFEHRSCPLPYRTRFDLLKYHVKPVLLHGVCRIVESRNAQNLDEVMEFYHEVLGRGGEGIILKDGNGEWEAKRVKHQVKMKLEKDIDLRIVDVVEGTGKNAGVLGALVLETDDGKLRVNVGTGFSDKQREEFWNKRNELIGKICTIKGNGIIDAKNKDKASIFLPVFVELREDKDVSNTFEEVKEVFNVG